MFSGWPGRSLNRLARSETMLPRIRPGPDWAVMLTSIGLVLTRAPSRSRSTGATCRVSTSVVAAGRASNDPAPRLMPRLDRVEQADRGAQDLVQGVGGLLQVDQVRGGRQQVAQELAVGGLGRDADDDLAGVDVQAEQVQVDGRQGDGGHAVGIRGDGEVAVAGPERAVADGRPAEAVAGPVGDRVVVDQVQAEGAGPGTRVDGDRVGRAGAGDAGDPGPGRGAGGQGEVAARPRPGPAR